MDLSLKRFMNGISQLWYLNVERYHMAIYHV